MTLLFLQNKGGAWGIGALIAAANKRSRDGRRRGYVTTHWGRG